MFEGSAFSSLLQVLPIVGVGSLITLLVQNWLRKRERISDRLYEEKREAFVGLLKSMGEYVASGGEQDKMSVAYWRMRCDIVSTKPTRDAINRRLDEGHVDLSAHEAMLAAMRRELEISE